ncbi:arginine/serine-rich protein PNISR-like isoform X1 [Limulus polyphemus]|uniref:Arginine/serine-rich protein PNISR-like isoform X1 n=1 Tax=Limulus polyphemus TaxID=6850 RepID=A0ABM1B2S9_LIMPO|nr:arginine/serine-rich protein PNISR-like isoform X1 [Limulus polyphemus]XP_013773630.1 arginine/serine-rich protein PNISR-like isoform X1 [Limulus polyphemus]
MWEGGPWQHWHLQASMYHNVPHEQVDWAALAKQWIQMQQFQQTMEDTPLPLDQEVPPPPPPPPLPPPPPPIEDSNPPMQETILTSTETTLPGVSNGRDSQVNSVGDGTFVHRNVIGNYWGGWGMNIPAPWGPASEDSATTSTAVGKEAFDYGHMHGNLPLNAQSYEYNHGSDQYAFNQAMFPQAQSDPQFPELDSQFPLPNHQFSQPDPQFTQPDPQFPQFWQPVLQPPDILAPPSFMKKNKKDFTDNELNKALEDTTQLDAVKRKQLPAWIREGLEKMERERQKKIEKEKAKMELEQKLKTEKEDKVVAEHEVKEEEELETHSSPAQVLKSKFESDSENEEGPQQNFVSRSPSSSHVGKTECSPPTIAIKSEEERKQEMILKVRRLLTEILLEVTNEELQICAEDVHKKAVNKAPARQLASSSALASLASGLGGLTGYGSNSEASGSEDSGSEDSDEELQQKIREKKKRFALKEKEILAAIGEEEAAERERESLQKQKALKEDLHQSSITELDEDEKKHNIDTVAEMPIVQNESQEVLINSPKNKSEKIERKDVRHEVVESKSVYEDSVKMNDESYNGSEESDSDTASSHSQNSEVGTGSSSSDTENKAEHKVLQMKAKTTDSSVTDSEDSSRTRSPVREKKELKNPDSHRKQHSRPSPSNTVKNRKGSHNFYSHHKSSNQRSSSERRRHSRKSDNERRSCKSRSGSLNREKKGFRKSTSRSLSREKKDFQKSKSRSISREKRVYHKNRSREKRVSRKSRSRSFSRERRRSHRVRSRSCSRDKRDFRKSRSRSLSRERRHSHRIRSRSFSREKRSSRKSRSVSREKKGSRKSKSRSLSREKRGSNRSRSRSLSKAKKGSRKSKSRSISREKGGSRKRSRSLNRGKEHRLSVKKSRRKSKIDKKSLSRSPTTVRSKSNNKKRKSGKHSLSPSRSPSRSPKRSKRRKSRSSSSE